MVWHLGQRSSAKLLQWYLGPDHPSKLRLWRYFLAALGNPRLRVPYGSDATITLDYRDWLQGTILRTGAYEPEVWSALTANLPQDAVFWDVGAHIGTFSILACRDSRFRLVHAFEPDPRTNHILRTHLALNPGVSRTVHEVALGATNENQVLTSGPAINSGMASLVPVANEDRDRCVVRCLTADSLVFEQGLDAPTVMKIDVEGWELEVLRGAERILRERPPRAIVFEAACEKNATEMDDPTIAIHLQARGYRVAHIPRPDGHLEPRENYLAVLESISDVH